MIAAKNSRWKMLWGFANRQFVTPSLFSPPKSLQNLTSPVTFSATEPTFGFGNIFVWSGTDEVPIYNTPSTNQQINT